jgi:hypothetical protein
MCQDGLLMQIDIGHTDIFLLMLESVCASGIFP